MKKKQQLVDVPRLISYGALRSIPLFILGESWE